MSLGWNLPPGVREADIDAHFREPDEDGERECPKPSRHCKCTECQNNRADLAEDL